jgi:glycosyltransferase involved in cell wall biosynthesis
LNILQAHNYYQLAGGEDTVVAQERQLLEENGHKVTPYYKHNSEIVSYSKTKKIGLLKNTTWSKSTIKEVKEVIKEKQIEICHVHNFLPLISPSIYAACAEMKVPVVQTLHNYRLICTNGLFLRNGNVCEECLGRSPYHSIAKKCYRDSSIQTFTVAHMLRKNTRKGTWNNLVNAYFCLTDMAKNKFSQHGIAKHLLHTKANFVDLNLNPIDQKKDYLIYVGRVEKNKGIELLKKLAPSLDQKIKIVGEGSEMTELEGVKNIELLGQTSREKTLELIREAKALLFPSRLYEGMPMTILEAFALKTPVIATNFGAMASMIEHKKNGLLFSLDSLSQLKENVKFALNENVKISEIANHAYEEYLKHYSKQANYEKMMAVFNDLISKKQ